MQIIQIWKYSHPNGLNRIIDLKWKLTKVNTCLLKYFNIYDYLQVYQVSLLAGMVANMITITISTLSLLSFHYKLGENVSVKYPIITDHKLKVGKIIIETWYVDISLTPGTVD